MAPVQTRSRTNGKKRNGNAAKPLEEDVSNEITISTKATELLDIKEGIISEVKTKLLPLVAQMVVDRDRTGAGFWPVPGFRPLPRPGPDRGNFTGTHQPQAFVLNNAPTIPCVE